MRNIEIDFEVHKELTYRRKSEDHTENDVIRELLKLPTKPKAAANGKKPWVSERVIFPSGTEFQGTRKGKLFTAAIDDGQLLVDGQPSRGLSHAVKMATGKGENGWKFWKCKRPGDLDFIVVDQLRKK